MLLRLALGVGGVLSYFIRFPESPVDVQAVSIFTCQGALEPGTCKEGPVTFKFSVFNASWM